MKIHVSRVEEEVVDGELRAKTYCGSALTVPGRPPYELIHNAWELTVTGEASRFYVTPDRDILPTHLHRHWCAACLQELEKEKKQ